MNNICVNIFNYPTSFPTIFLTNSSIYVYFLLCELFKAITFDFKYLISPLIYLSRFPDKNSKTSYARLDQRKKELK